jgi:hypothetical protein
MAVCSVLCLTCQMGVLLNSVPGAAHTGSSLSERVFVGFIVTETGTECASLFAPWTADPEPVLVAGDEDSWDSLQVAAPDVLRLSDGTYIMYYTGVEQQSVKTKLQYALSMLVSGL